MNQGWLSGTIGWLKKKGNKLMDECISECDTIHTRYDLKTFGKLFI